MITRDSPLVRAPPSTGVNRSPRNGSARALAVIGASELRRSRDQDSAGANRSHHRPSRTARRSPTWRPRPVGQPRTRRRSARRCRGAPCRTPDPHRREGSSPARRSTLRGAGADGARPHHRRGEASEPVPGRGMADDQRPCPPRRVLRHRRRQARSACSPRGGSFSGSLADLARRARAPSTSRCCARTSSPRTTRCSRPAPPAPTSCC